LLADPEEGSGAPDQVRGDEWGHGGPSKTAANSCRSAIDPIAVIKEYRHFNRMTSKLTLRYEFTNDPGDDFGWLTVEVVSDRFAGRGGFWVQWQDVAEFGQSLSTYPIPADAPLKAQWGFDMQEGEDLRLSIDIGPANSTGDLSVEAEVADYNNPTQRVRTSFLTNYPQLEAFRVSIASLMDRNVNEATLLGS
jgi:hypothetical protein